GTSASDFITNDTTLVVSGTNGNLAVGSKIQVSSNGGTTWTDVVQTTATTWSFDDTANPHVISFSYTARVVDVAGNVGNTATQAVTIDTTAPAAAETVAITAITTDTGTPGDYITNDTSLTVSGTNAVLSAGNRIQVSSDGGATWADATVTGTTWSYVDPVNHAANFTYSVRVVDTAGNVGNTANQAVTIDTTAPPAAETVAITAITTDTGTPGDFITNDTSLTVSGTNAVLAAGNRIQVSSDGGTTWANATVTGTTWTYMDPANHATSFSYQARVVDLAGNIGQTATQAVTIDTTAPATAETVAITAITTDTGTSASDFITNDTTLTVSGSNGNLAVGSKIQVSSNGGTTWTDVVQTTATTWSFDDTANPHATSFSYTARVVDVAGNVGNTATQAVTIDTTA
ncbi:MAG: type 1 secretion protein, partial [Comamonadaceae bacterium]